MPTQIRNLLLIGINVEADFVASVQVDVPLHIVWGVGQVENFLWKVTVTSDPELSQLQSSKRQSKCQQVEDALVYSQVAGLEATSRHWTHPRATVHITANDHDARSNNFIIIKQNVGHLSNKKSAFWLKENALQS